MAKKGDKLLVLYFSVLIIIISCLSLISAAQTNSILDSSFFSRYSRCNYVNYNICSKLISTQKLCTQDMISFCTQVYFGCNKQINLNNACLRCDYNSYGNKYYVQKYPSCFINFACKKGYKAFKDSCGCGCQISPTCNNQILATCQQLYNNNSLCTNATISLCNQTFTNCSVCLNVSNRCNQTFGAVRPVNLSIMKHFCPTISNMDQLRNLWANKTPEQAFIAGELACPVILLPGENATPGATYGGNYFYKFDVVDPNGTVLVLSQATLDNEKICENQANMDFDNDSDINANDCVDISHHVFRNLNPGITIVKETNSPIIGNFGTVVFTPASLNTEGGDNDNVTFVSFDVNSIVLNTSRDTDRNIMLHIYNFNTTNVTLPVCNNQVLNNCLQAYNNNSLCDNSIIFVCNQTFINCSINLDVRNRCNQTFVLNNFVNISIMKHLCPTISNMDQLRNLWANKTPEQAFLAGELACPVILRPGENPLLGASFGGNYNYDFSIIDPNSSVRLLSSAPLDSERICETYVNVDFDNDGDVNASECIDISHHVIANLNPGITVITENAFPNNTYFGAFVFTPASLNNEGGDNDNITVLNIFNNIITLNTSRDLDRNIMIHVYDFNNSNQSAGPINCSLNTDCGTNGFIGSPFCNGNDILQNIITYTCNNPGTSQSSCSNIVFPQLLQSCIKNQICSNGQCINSSLIFNVSVLITDFSFNPSEVQINPGDSVTWINAGAVNHTVTSDNGSELNSGILMPGQIYSHTFLFSGNYSYHCALHPNLMRGNVTVK